ncbi:MAG TPA: bacillithiol biosynthesis cysteine-adding enzyme BshC [Saprospiraceae bacterium]|nr:bacillithiol biosynthesis cysteine-adding enzyme BshC [Saprospiraceae bacterium]
MTEVSVHSIPFQRVAKFTQIDIDYATDPASLSEFISLVPNLSNFGKALANRSIYPTERELLVDVLLEQYAGAEQDGSHCEAFLDPAHFTVVTAHQPALLTGPLYFIYKICSTINLAQQISAAHPSYRVHPVFVLSGEDHDFDEVNHLHLFGKQYKWATPQTGAVGRMKVDGALVQLLRDMESVFGRTPHGSALGSLFHRCFEKGRSYGAGMQRFVMELFKDTGLIVLNMDDQRLKRRFADIIEDELLHQTSRRLIEQNQQALSARGYKPQTYQREINLFYLTDNLRGRIVESKEMYQVVDSGLTFTREEMFTELKMHPERFSPNVNLRPLYQELILPNLAYVGGGGELAYWLERKLLFDHYKVPLPILVRRNSILYLDSIATKQRRKLDIPVQELFETQDSWIAQWIKAHAVHEIQIDEEQSQIEKALDAILQKAYSIDPTLGSKYEAEKIRLLKDVDHLGKRLVRAEKAQNETRISQLIKLHEKLFPDGKLQERHDNFIAHYLRHGNAYLRMLISHLDPLFNEVMIIEESVSE